MYWLRVARERGQETGTRHSRTMLNRIASKKRNRARRRGTRVSSHGLVLGFESKITIAMNSRSRSLTLLSVALLISGCAFGQSSGEAPAKTDEGTVQVGPVRKTVTVPAGIMIGLLQHRVQPVYPEAAKQAGIEGVVVLDAVIGKDGHVASSHAISGPPELMSAANAAVGQWEYRPYRTGGEAVDVRMQIRVKFALASAPQALKRD